MHQLAIPRMILQGASSSGEARETTFLHQRISVLISGVVTALKPVQTEQVRQTEQSQLPGWGSVSLKFT